MKKKLITKIKRSIYKEVNLLKLVYNYLIKVTRVYFLGIKIGEKRTVSKAQLTLH